MKLDTRSLPLLDDALKKLEQGFSDLPDVTPQGDTGNMREILLEVAARMQDNFPYQHP